MPRLGRRSAGEQVIARANRLSDDLLVLEETCFEQIAAPFVEALPAVRDLVAAGWRRAKDDPNRWSIDARMVNEMLGAHGAASALTRGHVVGMAGRVRDLSLESIVEELQSCEATLGKRYEGLAVSATDAARERSQDLVTARLARFEDALQAGQAAFARELRRQVFFVGSRGETAEQADRRLFSETPVSMPGIGGRGVWWRATSGLNAAAREVSIRLASTVRLAAMDEFNARGADR